MIKVLVAHLFLALACPLAWAMDPDLQKLLEERGSRRIGGIYEGKVRPVYVENSVFLQLISPVISGDRPACATRNLVSLQASGTTEALLVRHNALLQSWIADREVVLVGNGNCTGGGFEVIIAVIPN